MVGKTWSGRENDNGQSSVVFDTFPKDPDSEIQRNGTVDIDLAVEETSTK